MSKETVTIRHSVNDVAMHNRQLGAFLPGNGVGGAGQRRELVQAVASGHGVHVCICTPRVPVVILGLHCGRLADVLELLESHGGGGRREIG